MTDDDDEFRAWFPCWDSERPCDDRNVAVLVALKDGTFEHDIGKFVDGKWRNQFWSESAVVAWHNLPPINQ